MKVLITGTSQGIGEAIADKFLENGFEVIGFDRLPMSAKQSENKKFKFYQIDISDYKNLPEIEDINIIVNNAGSLIASEALAKKLMGAFYVTEKYAFQDNIKSIVNISSNSAYFGIEPPTYVMANSAMIGYTRNLARRLRKYQPTVNSISPGYVDTTLEKHLMEQGLDKEVYKHYILKHIQKPSEIAELVYYLSVINKSITGQDILMDCGESLSSDFVESKETLEAFYSSMFPKE